MRHMMALSAVPAKWWPSILLAETRSAWRQRHGMALPMQSHWVAESNRLQLLFAIDLLQDVAVLWPLICQAAQDPRFQVSLWASRQLVPPDHAFWPWLQKAEINYRIGGRLQLAGGFSFKEASGKAAFDALISASESSAKAHWAMHLLTKRAKAAGIATFTLQHGLENIGLTYRDALHGAAISFASDHICIWGPVAALPDWLSPQTPARCIACGPTVAFEQGNAPATPVTEPAGAPIVAVFENLHWHRYDDGYRHAFIDQLVATAGHFGDHVFVLRPHPAGQWSTQQSLQAMASKTNLLIADDKAPAWARQPAAELMAQAKAVITTPSTVALDAARLDRPVAVVGNKLSLPLYAPLPILHSDRDWQNFIAEAGTGQRHVGLNHNFVKRHLVNDDGRDAILQAVLTHCARTI